LNDGQPLALRATSFHQARHRQRFDEGRIANIEIFIVAGSKLDLTWSFDRLHPKAIKLNSYHQPLPFLRKSGLVEKDGGWLYYALAYPWCP
jgi:hypothetical protein